MSTIIAIIEKICLSLIPLALKKILEFFTRPTPQGTRIHSIPGKWTGHFNQLIGPAEYLGEDRLDVDFVVKRKNIEGVMLLYSGNRTFSLRLWGTLEHESHLRLLYDNKDKNMKHFGCLLFELGSEGDELDGQFLGFGVQARTIVTGTINLKKKCSSAIR